jgi:small subunit ribosomal protein S16
VAKINFGIEKKSLAFVPPGYYSRPPRRASLWTALLHFPTPKESKVSMAVAIRLRREGSKDRPFYRIVVADSRSRRDGRFIEMIGTYDPMKKGEDNALVDLPKADEWIGKGAKASETVASIIRKARKAQPKA